MERQNVRVLQVGGDLDLLEEALGPDDRGKLGPQDLHRHLAVVLDIVGEIHRRHAAGAEFPLDLV